METENKENLNSEMQEETTNSTNSEDDTSREEPVQKDGETKEEFTEREKQYYARIKKLEEENKTLKSNQPKETSAELTSSDILAIARADIHEDDVDRVVKYAKTEGISIKAALADDDMQAILERRAELRKTQEASNTGSNRSAGATETSGDALVDRARRGQMPDTKDLEKFFAAQKKRK